MTTFLGLNYDDEVTLVGENGVRAEGNLVKVETTDDGHPVAVVLKNVSRPGWDEVYRLVVPWRNVSNIFRE